MASLILPAVLFELNVDPKLTVKSVDKLDFKWSDGKERELTQVADCGRAQHYCF